jgi:hypothetical protein
MRLLVLCSTLALLAVSPACRSSDVPVEPPAGFAHAIAQRDCAPTDGPALSIYLTPTLVDAPHPPPPFVRVSVYDSPADVIGRTWSWGPSTTIAGAVMCTSTTACVTSSSGLIILGRFAADSSLVATVDAHFPGGERIRGRVHGVWKTHPYLCG